jgi:hypothetical protein
MENDMKKLDKKDIIPFIKLEYSEYDVGMRNAVRGIVNMICTRGTVSTTQSVGAFSSLSSRMMNNLMKDLNGTVSKIVIDSFAEQIVSIINKRYKYYKKVELQKGRLI